MRSDEDPTFERDLAALEALFLWQLGDRESSRGGAGKKWTEKGDEAAVRAAAADAALGEVAR